MIRRSIPKMCGLQAAFHPAISNFTVDYRLQVRHMRREMNVDDQLVSHLVFVKTLTSGSVPAAGGLVSMYCSHIFNASARFTIQG